MARMQGESNVPGAPGSRYDGLYGNVFAGNLLAGNPLMDPRFTIPGKRSGGQPVLPGENKKDIEDVYGRPGMKQMPGFSPFQLPSAMGAPGMMQMGNMASMGNIGNAGFFMGPQMGQGIPPGYMNKIVS